MVHVVIIHLILLEAMRPRSSMTGPTTLTTCPYTWRGETCKYLEASCISSTVRMYSQQGTESRMCNESMTGTGNRNDLGCSLDQHRFRRRAAISVQQCGTTATALAIPRSAPEPATAHAIPASPATRHAPAAAHADAGTGAVPAPPAARHAAVPCCSAANDAWRSGANAACRRHHRSSSEFQALTCCEHGGLSQLRLSTYTNMSFEHLTQPLPVKALRPGPFSGSLFGW